jgi:sugar lactone lactonase YvrE
MILNYRICAALLWILVLLASAAPARAVDLLYLSGANVLYRYDTSSGVGTTIEATKSVFANQDLNFPQALAFDSSGNLYVVGHNNGTIKKFDSSGMYLSSITTNLSYPIGLAIDSSGNIFASNGGGTDTISKFNSSGVFVSSISTNLKGPKGLAFDSSGNLYVANYGDNFGRESSISKFNSSGAFITTIGNSTILQGVRGLAFDSSGNLYVSNSATSTGRGYISKFDSSGVFLFNITSNLSSPVGLAFDSSGNLYAADFGFKTICKFDTTGNFLTSWNTGIQSNYLAFQPTIVPEPSTYLMGAIATLLLARIVQKRRK